MGGEEVGHCGTPAEGIVLDEEIGKDSDQDIQAGDFAKGGEMQPFPTLWQSLLLRTSTKKRGQ
jgi:hypothetical protein